VGDEPSGAVTRHRTQNYWHFFIVFDREIDRREAWRARSHAIWRGTKTETGNSSWSNQQSESEHSILS